MLNILKWLGLALLALVLIAVVAGMIIHKPLPKGESGKAADALARKMMASLNQEAWDSTRFLTWDFAGRHKYLWDRERHLVEVTWGNNRVLLRTKDQSGKAYTDEQELVGEQADKLLQKAWAFFCNDSFWLLAFNKAFDPGTTRELVKTENDEEALLVRYNSGGVTPGDAYLWLLDEQYRPRAWRMWVQIIPIGGLKTSWESYQTLSTGASIPVIRDMGFFTLKLGHVNGASTLQALSITQDPFRALMNE